jgi:hypothetical protein
MDFFQFLKNVDKDELKPAQAIKKEKVDKPKIKTISKMNYRDSLNTQILKPKKIDKDNLNTVDKKPTEDNVENNIKYNLENSIDNINKESNTIIDESHVNQVPIKIEPEIEFRRGEMCRIIRMEGSYLNSFKGYLAEIKEYKKGNKFALVILHAQNVCNKIKMPVKQLAKLT